MPEKLTHSAELKNSFENLIQELATAVEKIDSAAYAAACSSRSRLLNLYIDRMKPWAIAKLNTPEAQADLREVLFTLEEGIRWLATAWMSVLPFGMPEVFRQLGLPSPSEQGALKALSWGQVEFKPLEPKPIYPRLELKSE